MPRPCCVRLNRTVGCIGGDYLAALARRTNSRTLAGFLRPGAASTTLSISNSKDEAQ